jgi:hypothetical protein
VGETKTATSLVFDQLISRLQRQQIQKLLLFDIKLTAPQYAHLTGML